MKDGKFIQLSDVTAAVFVVVPFKSSLIMKMTTMTTTMMMMMMMMMMIVMVMTGKVIRLTVLVNYSNDRFCDV